jgi:enoyl-CoA hydratase/carnithine racemase
VTTKFTQFAITERSEWYWRVTFNNPPLNLVGPETIVELQAIVELLEASENLKVVVFDSGNPEFFIARYDLARAAETPVTPGRTGLPMWVDLTTRLSNLPVISIACIRGRTRGIGSEFALACDMRFASKEKALFGQPEVAAGVFPGGGAIERLPDLVGRARALEIIVGSDDYDADLAERYGWINRSLPDAELDAFVDRLAERIASFERPPIAEAKRLLNRRTLPANDDLAETHNSFLAATGAPSAMIRGVKARQIAKSAGLDFELRLGHYLGQL